MNAAVPFGLRGTVTGIHRGDESSDVMYDVVFDDSFLGGQPLRCSSNKVYLMSASSLINISYGDRCEAHQSQYSSASCNIEVRLLSSQLQQTKWTEDGWPAQESDLSGTTVHLHRCRLLRTLHHQGRTQGSKTIRRSIHVFSQSSSPYWGGKFSWIKFIYYLVLSIISTAMNTEIRVQMSKCTYKLFNALWK